MKYRNLRIAWSVAWGLVCLLLILLSVRSFAWADQTAVRLWSNHHVMLGSQLGGVWFSLENSPRVIRMSTKIDALYYDRTTPQPEYVWTRVYIMQGQYGGGAPHWLLALASAVTATLPWKPWKWRFSLRTLLIGMTVVAVILGAVAYAVN
jgi:hypothetical protein